jgi:transposase
MKSKRPQKNKKAICRPTQNNWHQMNRKQRREMTRKIQSEDLSLEVVHPHGAGMDIGNESHYLALPPTRDRQPVRRFGCATSELKGWRSLAEAVCDSDHSAAIDWSVLDRALRHSEEAGFEVYLVNAKETKN